MPESDGRERPESPGRRLDFLAGEGEMARRLRDLDWTQSALGDPRGWPQSLRTAVDILLNSRHPMFLAWGPELSFLYNDAYRPIFGDKHPAALGQPFARIWAEIWNDIQPLVQRALAGKPTWSENLQLFMARRGFTEETYFTFSYSPVRGDDGVVSGIFCACTETTGEVLGERRLRALRDLAAATSEARDVREACGLTAKVLTANGGDVPFGLIYLTGSGDDGARLVAATGCAAGESSHLPAIVEKIMSERRLSLAAEDDSKGQVVENLDPALGLPGGPWPEPVTTIVVLPLAQSGPGRPRGVLVTGASPRLVLDESYRQFLDVLADSVANGLSNANAYEAERNRVKALTEIDALKTAFFSNVSHEFRTPLTLMLGPLEDLLQDDRLSAGVQQHVAVAHRNALRLLKLVNSLLDFSRIEAKRVRASFEPTDLGTLTTDLVSNFRSACERASLDLQVHCDTLPFPVYVDREMWEKIVLNLLSNAFKFTFEGGIEVSLSTAGGKAVLRVCDTGVGIPAAEIPRLFERFHRVEGARGRTYEGTGIGLALVQELVHLHGGSVGVESELERGTTVTVTVPPGSDHLPPEQVREQPLATQRDGQARAYVEEALRWLPDGGTAPRSGGVAPGPGMDVTMSGRVLVADDNADMRDYVRRVLGDQFEVETVADGRAALESARRALPDVVLSDIMMPGMDGFKFLERLRADERTRAVPVILMSARAGEEARIEGLDAFADDYLTKPFTARELYARVETQVRMNRMRRESEQRLREFADTAPAMLWITDRRHRATFLSRGWYEFTGQTTAEALGEGWTAAIHPADRERSAAAFVAAAERREAFVLDYRLRRADGEYRWAIDAGRPRISPDGTFRGFIGSVIDVHQRKQAEQAVRDSEQRFRQVFDTVGVSVWIEDFTAVKAAIDEALATDIGDFRVYLSEHPEFVRRCVQLVRIVDVNRETLAMFGAGDKSELLQSLANIFTEQTEAVFAEELVAIAEGKSTFRSEASLRSLDGRAITAQFTIHFDPAGDYGRVVVSLADITLRKEAEDALQDINRQKDRFLATLSHELRNPLSSLVSALEVMRIAGHDGDAGARSRAIMERQVSQLCRLVDDLLDLSRITRGRLELKKSRIDIADVVRAALEDTRPLFDRKDQTCLSELPASSIIVEGDAVRLGQVLTNLLNNAARYTPKGGCIELSVERLSDEVALRVRDNGVGIPAEQQAFIFEMFSQIDGQATDGHSGLGIGLNLARTLVGMHGGRIEVFSEGNDRGSEFTVWLPLAAG